MDNSLILSLLPKQIAYCEALGKFRQNQEAPRPSDIANNLIEAELHPRTAWTYVNNACRQAELTSKAMLKIGVHVVHFWDRNYPPTLRWYDDPPWNIFFVGDLPKTTLTLSIVGTRKPNSYGEEVLSRILPYIVPRPLQIVSGLAYGIDSLAHYYACEMGIPNFGVLGCGIDRIYPEAHQELAARMIKVGGGVLSEFPPGTEPFPGNFPRRNRIISGLADVLWVVQGTGKSGSLHTVRHGLSQGKTIATTPGDIFSELSELPHRLLMDGAHLIAQADDLNLLLETSEARVTH